MMYIIIPVHNRKHYTRECLRCLQKQTFKDFQIIVVDDGSTDGTAELIYEEFPEVTVLRGDGNFWWTKAINVGVRYAMDRSSDVSLDTVLTLNDDLLVDTDYLNTIVADFRVYQPCLMGSVVVDVKNPNYLEYAGASCNYMTAKGYRTAAKFGNNYQQLKAAHDVVPTDDLSGRGTLIPMSVFKNVGLYDEQNFPHYMADIELSVRARRKGFPLYISVGSVVSNYMEATRNKSRTWSEFVRGFFSFKSPNYLRPRYVFAVRHTPIKQLYFLVDISRLTASFAFKR